MASIAQVEAQSHVSSAQLESVKAQLQQAMADLGWPTLVSAISVMVSFAFATAIGIFFGYYPAHKAAALDPIEALRYE